MEGADQEASRSKRLTTTSKQRRLKRKSEEGCTIDQCLDGSSPVDERLSPKLRKYSRRLPPIEHQQCLDDGDAKLVDEETTLHLSCQNTNIPVKREYSTVEPCRHNNKPVCIERRRPFVPCLDYLNEDRTTECPSFILSPRAEEPYKCKSCTKQFKYFSNLKSHMKIVHKKIINNSPKDAAKSMQCNGQVFECEVCFRNFKYPGNLRTHRLVHTGTELEAVGS